MIVDVHTHVVPTMSEPGTAARDAGWPYVVELDGRREVFAGDRLLRVVDELAWDPSARLAWMDRQGVDVHVALPAPFTFLYRSEPGVAADFAVAQNEAIAAFCAAQPHRLVGFASVPLCDPDRAVEVLRDGVVRLGLRGVEIGSNAGDILLHDERLTPFFAAVEELDVPVFLHPGPLERPERTAHSGLGFGLARPVETELAVGSLVHGGVLERHPRLRICLAHGGAGVPALAGRWEVGWARGVPGTKPGSSSPRHLLRRLWADTLTYDPYVLPLVERTFGSHHLVVGTDMPFAAQETPPGTSARLANSERLFSDPQLDLEAMARNAHAFLGVPVGMPDPRPTTHARRQPA